MCGWGVGRAREGDGCVCVFTWLCALFLRCINKARVVERRTKIHSIHKNQCNTKTDLDDAESLRARCDYIHTHIYIFAHTLTHTHVQNKGVRRVCKESHIMNRFSTTARSRNQFKWYGFDVRIGARNVRLLLELIKNACTFGNGLEAQSSTIFRYKYI